ncbi:MAG: neutral/alkaline non-lysosomal ceramidase N-terminal domain-containing protein [Verrucomicrobia bacterium]|nr:neutral/alkaline non-lysosomal ceramidase N-terminal domain-containing protein [Verrucomicrobiota bacterium]
MLLLIGRADAADVQPWQAGVSRKAITPQAPHWMTGYAVRDHPAEGKAQELWAKALALRDSAGNQAVLITVDLCGVPRNVSDRVAAELEKRFAIPRRAVMVNASHTHCSPSVEGYIIALRPFAAADEQAIAAYTRRLENDMIEAAAAAVAALQPATLGASHGLATFGVNRRKNTEANATARMAAGTLQGPADHDVPVLAVRDAAGKIVALLASYACHNTTLNFYQWHGDYAGAAVAELERRHAGATALFVAGCGGNINPFPRGTLELAEKHGRELADAVDLALSGLQQPVRGELVTAFSDLTLKFAKAPTAAEIAAAAADDPKKAAVVKQMDVAWAKAMNAEVARGGIKLDYAYPIQAWRLGDITWVALGGEVVVDYALRLKAEAAREGRKLWVFAYSNDVMAYIPSESVLAEAAYEGKSSMIPYGRPSPWAAGLEDKIVGKVKELVREVGVK